MRQRSWRDIVGMPTLILAGAKDEVTPAADCARLAQQQTPGMAKFVVYPGAAHAFDLPEFGAGEQVMGMVARLQPQRRLSDRGRSCTASLRPGSSARPSPRPGGRRGYGLASIPDNLC